MNLASDFITQQYHGEDDSLAMGGEVEVSPQVRFVSPLAIISLRSSVRAKRNAAD
jgi:hypothetical protein